MPNFWSKSGQFFSEKLFGSRTKDEDFNKVCETMKNTEKGLCCLRTALQNFLTYSENFKKYFSEFNSAIQLIYANSPFTDFVEEITVKHQVIQAEMEETRKKMNNLFSKTSEWNIIFNSAKENIKTREEKRKVYDHYEAKLAKINKNPGKKDVKYIERNEAKFSKAASEYVEISEKAFNTIGNCLKLTYELTNPIIDGIITVERILFQNLSTSLSCFKNNSARFDEIKINFYNPNLNKDNITYDPIKYMNEKDLMKKISHNRKYTTYVHLPSKKIQNQNKEKKNNHRSMTLSVKQVNQNKEYMGIENYDNIYINSRMTNSFGEMSEEKLNEFYEFEDDFD